SANFGPKTDFATGYGPISVALADLNRDGRLDLAVANDGANTVSVLLGIGGGSFGPKTDFAAGYTPASAAIGDLNGDGLPDLAVANYGASTVSVLLNTVDHTPPTAQVLAPNGGETIGKGTTSTIAWTASDNIGVDHVDLYYSHASEGTASYTLIAANQPNSGTYSWSVPRMPINESARVKVVAFDASGNSGADASDANFTINDPNLPTVTL